MENLEEELVVQEEPIIEEIQKKENPFVPAPAGSLYAEVDGKHKLIIQNQVIAFEQGLPIVEFESAWNGDLYEKGYAPAKPEEEIKKEHIAELKEQLDSTDYKIIKCSECSLAGAELPYDIAELHAQRQAIRDEINELEGE